MENFVMMSLKEKLKELNKSFIMDYDFSCVLPTDEAAMLNYFIDACDHFDVVDIRVTPSFIRRKRPNWTVYFIRKTIRALIEDEILEKVADNPTLLHALL